MQLNPQQEIAVGHTTGPCLVVAVPGSGKTRVLVERTIRLIESGVDPKDIISLTFTNKAAKEMKDRIAKRLNTIDTRMFVGTFHSLCAKILRQFCSSVGLTKNFTILDESDQKSLIEKIIERLHPNYEDDFNVYEIINTINNSREEMVDISQDLTELFKVLFKHDPDLCNELASKCNDIAKEYFKNLKEMNSIDFSGLLYETIVLFNKDERIRNIMQNCHKYLQIDETQDTNYAQFYIIEILSEKHNNVFIIGDTDQSVYGWRGARYQNIDDYINKHKNCKIIKLEYNYRSTPQIMAAADKLIKHNTQRIDKDFKITVPSGDPVSYKEFENPDSEADFIAHKIKSIVDYGEKYSFRNFVVLYRTNFLSRVLEENFINLGIPYKIVGGFSFYERVEIKDCLAMLRLFVNRNDTLAFHRVMKLMDGVGIKTIDLLESYARKEKTDLVDSCIKNVGKLNKKSKDSVGRIIDAYTVDMKDKNTSFVLTNIINRIGYEKILQKSNRTNIDDRIDNVMELIASANSLENKELSVGGYLQKVSLITSADEKAEKDQVTLMTLHAAKGLEFPVVFIVGVEKNLLPHVKAVEERGEEEERRLFYVGITRAQYKLFLSSCKRRPIGYGKNEDWKACYPSPFLKQAGIF